MSKSGPTGTQTKNLKRRTDATKIHLSLLFDEEERKFGPNNRSVGTLEDLSIGNCTLIVCLYMRIELNLRFSNNLRMSH